MRGWAFSGGAVVTGAELRMEVCFWAKSKDQEANLTIRLPGGGRSRQKAMGRHCTPVN
jgi:hypothetical protein